MSTLMDWVGDITEAAYWIAGRMRLSSSSGVTGELPGRVDSPPMSIMSEFARREGVNDAEGFEGV